MIHGYGYIHLLSNIPRTRLHGLERRLQDPDQRSHFDLPCAAINRSSGGLRHITFLGFGTGTLFRILSCILEDIYIVLCYLQHYQHQHQPLSTIYVEPLQIWLFLALAGQANAYISAAICTGCRLVPTAPWILHELPRWANLPGWGSFTLLRAQSSHATWKHSRVRSGVPQSAMIGNRPRGKLECCNLRRLWLLGVSSATGSFPESLWNKTRSLSMQACQWNVTVARATCDKDKTASVLGRCAGASKKIRRSCPGASNISYIATLFHLTTNYLSLSWI